MGVTINDVAKHAGVSKTTVSRILNGNFKQTREETKQKVLDVIRELDYRPNALSIEILPQAESFFLYLRSIDSSYGAALPGLDTESHWIQVGNEKAVLEPVTPDVTFIP
jgi:transcriptional regulator with XRE-family HTH domain